MCSTCTCIDIDSVVGCTVDLWGLSVMFFAFYLKINLKLIDIEIEIRMYVCMYNRYQCAVQLVVKWLYEQKILHIQAILLLLL